MKTRAWSSLILGCVFWVCACSKVEPTKVDEVTLRERLRGTEWAESPESPGMFEGELLFFQCNDTLCMTHPAYGTQYYACDSPEDWVYGNLWLGNPNAPGVKHLPWFIDLSANDTVMMIRGQKSWTGGTGSELEMRGIYILKRREDCHR